MVGILEDIVVVYYGCKNLIEMILDVFKVFGVDIEILMIEVLVFVDEFYIVGKVVILVLFDMMFLCLGMYVFDIGCGIGGIVWILVIIFGCFVSGIDFILEFIEMVSVLIEWINLVE